MVTLCRRRPRHWIGAGPFLSALFSALFLSALSLSALSLSAVAEPTYIGSASCTACHADATEAWKDSHHALAWTPATPDKIVADFDGTVFTHDGMTARFRIAPDGRYHVNVTEKDGVTTDYPIHSVAGIEPLQQYLIETEPGRLQSFDVVWDTEQGGWFHLYPEMDLPPGDGLHWTGPYKSWNARCAECHATGFKKNYDPVSRQYASTQVEIGVGCEACHGPGSTHVAWAETTLEESPPANYGFAVDFSDTEAAITQCATCHARREAHLDGNPMPGTAFQDAYNLALLRPGLYHADGQILEEVYVYGSFLQSKMYAAGVGCLDCHAAHETEMLADGNAVCTQCHNPDGNARFTTLSLAEYDSPAHHFHQQGTPAAECKACHMIEQVYMGNDWRADHSFRVPRPDLAAVTGAPDTCTACHTDRDPAWAAAALEGWYPDSRHRGPSYAEVLAKGRENAVYSAEELAALAEDATEPAIVRATALWLLEQSNSPMTAERLEPLLNDADPLIRSAAIGVQAVAPPQERALRVLPLLDDPIRSVRIAAARRLVDAPIARLPQPMAEDLRMAMREWQLSLGNRLDFPETHLQIAGISLTLRNMAAAARAFEEVVRLDPQRSEAWVMRIRIAAALEGPDQVRDVLDRARAALPNDPDLQEIEDALSGQPAAPAPLPPAPDPSSD